MEACLTVEGGELQQVEDRGQCRMAANEWEAVSGGLSLVEGQWHWERQNQLKSPN